MKRLLSIVVLMMLSVAMVVQAQDDATPIAIGDTVEDTLTEDVQEKDYTFSATAGDTIIVDLVSPDFDTYVLLLGDNGIELTRNDDGGEGLNSRILGFEIPEDGEYTIRASSYSRSVGSGTAVGDFTLTLDMLEVTPIEYGQTLSGTAEGFIGPFQFNAEVDTLVSATLTTEGFDTQLTLVNPDGREVAYGNYVDGLTTTISPYNVETSGNFLINASGSGEYTLTLERVNAIPVALGESVTGTFDENTQTLYFSYDNNAGGEVVDIIVDSGNSVDTTMSVASPFGYEQARNEDGDNSVDPALMSESLNDIGLYLIAIRAQNANARLQGDILFTVRPAELTILDENLSELVFDFDNDEELLTFEGVAGETVRVTVAIETADDFSSPFLEFIQGGLTVANFNMNGLSRIVADIPIDEDGTVTVRIQSYSSLNMTLSLERLAE